MARVTDAEVKEIIETELDTTPFIRAANLVVTDKLGDQGLGDDILMEIERYLSAHFTAVREQQAADETLGEARVKYQGQWGMGLDSTSYGQTAKLLDTSGILSTLGRRAAMFDVLDTD
jgi:hypothetical protein